MFLGINKLLTCLCDKNAFLWLNIYAVKNCKNQNKPGENTS
jgi:hypothetical protein